MQSILARVTGSPQARIRIKPDSDYIFLSGYGEEARGQYLRGKVLLTLSKGESVKGVQLKMVGQILNGHHQEDKSTPFEWETTEIFLHQWEPFLVKDCVRPVNSRSGTYEWPFELLIPGNQVETFRGCSRCSIIYRLDASTLNGTSRNVRAFVPIRIIRSPPISSYELMDPATTHGKWVGKIEYNISIGHQAIALGGFIPIEAQLAKLEPGVEVKKAKFYLRESHETNTSSPTDRETYYRLVKEWPLTLDHFNQDMHDWQHCLDLPRIVRMCSPDFEGYDITISHTLHFAVTLLEDGIESEYETPIPINLFISPDYPVTGWDVFVSGNERITKPNPDILAEGIQIPPRYCKMDECTSYFDTFVGSSPPAYSKCLV